MGLGSCGPDVRATLVATATAGIGAKRGICRMSAFDPLRTLAECLLSTAVGPVAPLKARSLSTEKIGAFARWVLRQFVCRVSKWSTSIVRTGTIPGIAGNLVLLVSVAIGGCDRFKPDDPARAGKARAEVKRQQAACGSASAGDRLKNSIFDEAIARRHGSGANLDVLADYSVARLQDPVVKGWDRSLDITRCRGRFILEVPPGAERGFGGQRELQTDIDYTAQASADGAGFVYQQKGAEAIVARVAAFNLGTGAYRPPPAIDEPQAPTELAEQTTVAEPQAPPAAPSPPAMRAAASPPRQVPPQRPVPAAPTRSASRVREADRTSAEPTPPVPSPAGTDRGEATVRAFYNALGAGNGAAASSQVIPEKRSSGAFSPGAMSRFYGRLPEPIRLTGIVPLAGGGYRVRYRYSAGRSRCNGSAVVRLTNRGGRNLIRSIQSLSGC